METNSYAQARRCERKLRKLHVTVRAKSMGSEFEQPASTMDVSERGARIRTDDPFDEARPLNPGQTVFVYGVGRHMGYCRVVWVHTESPDRPSEAGLEFLN